MTELGSWWSHDRGEDDFGPPMPERRHGYPPMPGAGQVESMFVTVAEGNCSARSELLAGRRRDVRGFRRRPRGAQARPAPAVPLCPLRSGSPHAAAPTGAHASLRGTGRRDDLTVETACRRFRAFALARVNLTRKRVSVASRGVLPVTDWVLRRWGRGLTGPGRCRNRD